jgi:protein-disulfide isomerase
MARQSDATLTRRQRREQERAHRVHDRSTHRIGQAPAWRSPVALTSIGAVALGAIVILFLVLSKPAPAASGEVVFPPTSYSAALTDGQRLGSPTAPVTMELYADFQCPACKSFVTEQLPALVRGFIETGALRIEPKDIDILGRGSPSESLELGAGAACAGEQDRYWAFHDLVFWNQGRENRGDHDSAFIRRMADAADVDLPTWDACNARADVRSAIASQSSAAAAAGINSTPTLKVNGQVLVGVPEAAKLRALISQLATKAGWSPTPSAGG